MQSLVFAVPVAPQLDFGDRGLGWFDQIPDPVVLAVLLFGIDFEVSLLDRIQARACRGHRRDRSLDAAIEVSRFLQRPRFEPGTGPNLVVVSHDLSHVASVQAQI